MCKIRFSSTGVCAVLAAIAILPSLTAQQAPAAKWNLVTITTIKPDMRNEYEAWQKEVTAAYKKAEVPSRTVLQTILGDLFEYISVTPLVHFGDMDGASPLVRSLGKDGAASLLRKGSPYMLSMHRISSLDADDLGIQTRTPEPLPYAVVTSMRLVTGKASEFDAWMKNDYTPVMKKGEVKNFWVKRTVFGGDPNERVTVRPLKNLAEIDAGPIATKVLGAEGSRKLMAKSAGIVESVQYRMVRYRADLSYQMSPPQTSTDAAK
jgi:hypothetical protein